MTKGLLVLNGWPEDVPVRGIRQLTSAQVHALHQCMSGVSIIPRARIEDAAQESGDMQSSLALSSDVVTMGNSGIGESEPSSELP